MDVIILELPEVEGTTQITGYEGKIELLGYSHSVSMNVTGDVSNTERTTGKPMHQDFAVSKYIDQATPTLNQACCEGKTYDTITVTVGRNDAGAIIPLITYTLTNAIISSISVSGGAGGKPVESLSLNYGAITWDFATQKEEGGPEGTVEGKWDVSANTAA